MADAIVAHHSGPLISRTSARAAGLKRYFTGLPCKYGHIAERITSHRRCVECHNAQYRAYAIKNPEKVSALFKVWRESNLKNERARSVAWKAGNREHVAEYNRTYAAENPGIMRAKARNRRARKQNAEGNHTAEEIQTLYTLQHGRCAHKWCRATLRGGYHADHIVSLFQGGSNWIRNIQLLCPTCNLKKHSKDPIDWAQENGMLL